MKRFVTTAVAWLILLGITYSLRTPIASPLVETAIGYWDIETFALNFFWSPIITLVCWGLYIKNYYDTLLFYAGKQVVFPSYAETIRPQPQPREEVTD